MARQILEAATPKVARQLVHIATTGTLPEVEEGGGHRPVALPDRLKAMDAVVARGGVPIRTELTGADGAPFTLLVKAATDGD